MAWLALIIAACALGFSAYAAVVAGRTSAHATSLETRVGYLEETGFRFEREARRKAEEYQVRVYVEDGDVICENVGHDAVYDVNFAYERPAEGRAPITERVAVKFPCEQLYPGSTVRLRGTVAGDTARSLDVHWRWINEGGRKFEKAATLYFARPEETAAPGAAPHGRGDAHAAS